MFSEPSDESIAITLTTPDTIFKETFLTWLYPTLEQLCHGLSDSCAGREARRVVFFLEPAELDLVLTQSSAGSVLLTIDLYYDHRRYIEARRHRVFEYEGPCLAIAMEFWRALRKLQVLRPSAVPARALASLRRAINDLEGPKAG